jgi:uncharacterized protein DUF5670
MNLARIAVGNAMRQGFRPEGFDMLWTVCVVLLVLWLLGLVSAYTMGGFVHVLLLLALLLVVFQMVQGERARR